MGLPELFVKHVQQYVPTLALRLLGRAYLKFYAGWRMRGGAGAAAPAQWERLMRRVEKLGAAIFALPAAAVRRPTSR